MSYPRERIEQLDANLRAANYLSAAQLYLRSNALLREPLRPEHIKARLLGHWGTVPGINLVYAAGWLKTPARACCSWWEPGTAPLGCSPTSTWRGR